MAGIIAFGVLGWAAGLTAAIVGSGAAMALLGVLVAARFPEDSFQPVAERRWTGSLRLFRQGAGLARRAHQILLMFAATMLVNGAVITTWLFPRQLADLGFPHDLVLWYTGLGVLASAAGVVALIGCLGVLLVSGIGDNVTRAVSVIWVNRRTPAAVRATVHSFLSQAETVGEILGGGTLAALARAAGLGATLLTAAGLLAGTGALAARSRAR